MSCAENDKKSRTVTVGASGWWRQSLEQELLRHDLVKGPMCLVRRTSFVPLPMQLFSDCGVYQDHQRLHKTEISPGLGWGLRIGIFNKILWMSMLLVEWLKFKNLCAIEKPQVFNQEQFDLLTVCITFYLRLLAENRQGGIAMSKIKNNENQLGTKRKRVWRSRRS